MSKGSIAHGTEAYVDRIHGYLDDSVQGIINAGRELNKAQGELPKGTFTDMVNNRLRITGATAFKLMKIAASEWIISNWKSLPPHWTTLYAVSRLDNDVCDQALKDGVINPDMQASDVPRQSRTLSAGARPRGRPPKSLAPPTIDGTATEVKAKALPLPEPPQPPRAAPPQLDENVGSGLDIWESRAEQHRVFAEKLQRDVARLEAENAKLRERPPEPEIEVPPLGSSDTVVLTLYRGKHEHNFWQGLMLAIGEWSELGSLEGLVPTDDALKILEQYDLGKFIDELDLLRADMQEMRETDGVDDAA